MDALINFKLRRLFRFVFDNFPDHRHVPVVDVGVCNDVDELTRTEA